MSFWWPEPSPVRVHFHLDAARARQALRDALDDERFGRGRQAWSFQGEVLQRRVTVHARWGFGRADATVLTGEVVPAQGGSDFIGTTGWPRWSRWLGIVAWTVLAVDLVALAYVLWVAVTGLGPAPQVLTTAVGPGVFLPFAAVFGVLRRGRIRRDATPPTAAEALRQWLEATAKLDQSQ